MAPTTRQQQKRTDAERGCAGLQPSTQDEIITAPILRRNQKRKASALGLEDMPALKRSQHDRNGDCATNGYQNDELERLQEDLTTDLNSIPDEQPQSKPSSLSSPPLRSPFLALPRELRDEIYKYILFSGEKRAITLKNRTFITKTSLARTNKQIRQEFLDSVLSLAPVIHTTVRNHNFAHVVGFLNRLSESQLRKFATAARPNSDAEARVRSRKVIITLTYSRTKVSTKPQLNRWLDRFDDPMRRGQEVRFEYWLDRLSWRNGGYKQRASIRATAGPRSREETKKIIDATRVVGSWW